MRAVPRSLDFFAHQLILFGRKLCQARKPLCADCPLENICDSPDKTV
jgi:endonuclease-3